MAIVPNRRRALALMGTLIPAAAFGAAYPDRPVRLVVALAAGGPADTAARVFAPHLAEALGQSVFIENRTGASSVIGTEAVVRAAADGYTLLFGSSSSFAVNPAVMKSLRFDVQKDLKLADGTVVAPAGASMSAALEAVRKVSSAAADRALPDFRIPRTRPMYLSVGTSPWRSR